MGECCRKLCHRRMRSASMRLIALWTLWIVAVVISVTLVGFIWFTTYYHTHVREREYNDIVEYAVSVFEESCPSDSTDYKRAIAWMDKCNDLHFPSEVRRRGMAAEGDSLKLAVAAVARLLFPRLQAEEGCNASSTLLSISCWAFWVLTHRDSFLLSALATCVGLCSALGFVLGPWSGLQHWATSWEVAISLHTDLSVLESAAVLDKTEDPSPPSPSASPFPTAPAPSQSNGLGLGLRAGRVQPTLSLPTYSASGILTHRHKTSAAPSDVRWP